MPLHCQQLSLSSRYRLHQLPKECLQTLISNDESVCDYLKVAIKLLHVSIVLRVINLSKKLSFRPQDLIVSFPTLLNIGVCARQVTSTQRWWHSARREHSGKGWCWTPTKSCTSGSRARWWRICTLCSRWTRRVKVSKTEPLRALRSSTVVCSTGSVIGATALSTR